jgi:CTP synthase
VHVTLVPFIGPAGEQKTKPTQHSVTELRSRGIQPDVIVCRSDRRISDGLRSKISNLCDVPLEGIINAPDAASLYEIPLMMHDEGLDTYVCDLIQLSAGEPDLVEWRELVSLTDTATKPLSIGIVGKYISLPDAYLSVAESLRHAALHNHVDLEIEWVMSDHVEGLLVEDMLGHLDGIILPGGFGERGIEGKIEAARFARETGQPCLGLCLGMQVMTIEYARHVLGLVGAHSSEFDTQDNETPHPVIDLMDSQRGVTDKGGTMRLGAYVAVLDEGSQVSDIYGETVIKERHRHRYEFNPRYQSRFEEDPAGFRCTGKSPDGLLVEFIELNSHPFWIGTQAHPELKSRPNRPAPLFNAFIAVALAEAQQKHPERYDLPQIVLSEPVDV